jgi:hypothetical protein
MDAAGDITLSSYLTRLVTRGPDTAAGVLPFVRSRSPVAEQDQRLGTTGFEDVAIATLESVHEWVNPDPVAVDRPVLSYPPAGPDISVAGIATGRAPAGWDAADPGPRRRAPSEEPAAKSAGPREEKTGSQPDRGLAPALSAHNRSLRQTIAAATGASLHVDFGSPRIKPAPGGTPTEVTRGGEAQPAPGVGRDERVAAEQQLPIALKPAAPMLEPVLVKTSQPERMRATTDAPHDERAPLPRVFIGRINVEVVSPKADPGVRAVSRPLPATAESVSVIGPLGAGMSASRRISLRYR